MKKDFFNNLGWITLLFSTLFFIKVQLLNNSAYAAFQRSFDFLINVILFICFAGTAYYIYRYFNTQKGNRNGK